MKALKIIATIIGILLSVGLWLPVVFETSNWGIDYLNSHNLAQRWPLYIGALVAAFLAGLIIGGAKAMFTNQSAETVGGETNLNPAWGWAVVALLINLAFALLLE